MVPIEFLPRPDETMTTVTFNFSPSPQQTTRATDENAVSKIQLLLVGADGQRYYFVPGEKTFLVESIKRGRYEVYAVANHPDIIKDYSAGTLAGLTSGYKDSDERIVMSFRGTADFSVSASSKYAVNLVRTVAKLRFNVKAADNVTINKMTLCNVPTASRIFPQAISAGSYSEKAIGVPADGTFTILMPENLAGTVPTITDQRDRTAAKSPATATYLLIEGEVVVETPAQYGTGIIYDRKKFESRVYLGSNTSTDFNVRRNNDYKIEINVAGDLTTDYRIELYDVGYTVMETLSPDGKHIINDTGIAHFVDVMPYVNKGGTGSWSSGSVAVKCVVENITKGMHIEAYYGYTIKRETNAAAGTITAYGTIPVGGDLKMRLYANEDPVYTPQTYPRYTLTFTAQDGSTAEYKRELRFANKFEVRTHQPGSNDYISRPKKANITSTQNVCFIPTSDWMHRVWHAEKTLRLTIEPLPGYTFRGWYSDYWCKPEALIGTCATVDIQITKSYQSIYAWVE